MRFLKFTLLLLPGFMFLSSCEKTEDESPDLSAIQLFSATSLAPGTTVQEVIIINNSGLGPTSDKISFTVSKFPANSGLTIAMNNLAGVRIGSDTFALSNSNWDTVSTANEITFTSKDGYAIGGQYASYIGLTITRGAAPNQGTAGTVTQTVTIKEGTGGNETPSTNNTATTTLTKTSVADLSASQFFSSLQVSAGGSLEEVILIRNVGAGATTGPITFTVTNYDAATGLTVTSNTNPTVTIGFDTFTLTNADWNVTVGASSLTFTSKPGVTIGPGASKLVGVTITRGAAPNQGPNGSVNHTVTITPGTGGGESPSTNNIVFNNILKI